MNFTPSAPAHLRILRRGLVYRLPAHEARRIVDAEDLQSVSAGVYFANEGGLPLVVIEPSAIQFAAEAEMGDAPPPKARVVMLAGPNDIGLAVMADEVSIDQSHDNTDPAISISVANFAEVNPVSQKV